MKSKFLQISLGVALILASTGFVLRSIGSLNASPNSQMVFQDGTGKVGKYMFQYVGFENPNYSDRMVVWDTETGKNALYYVTSSAWVLSKVQLPPNPLGN